jgi:hypothetical protein
VVAAGYFAMDSQMELLAKGYVTPANFGRALAWGLANALFALTGEPVRRLPLSRARG